MKRAAKSSFFRLLSLCMGLQFTVAPLANAIDNNTVKNIATAANTLSQTAQGMMQQMAQQKQAAQMAQGLQTYKAQQIPPNLVAVPAFSTCAVFMAETNQPEVGLRCEGPIDQNLITYYSELKNIATSNVETYGVYTTKGNASTSQGSRCLDDAETQFNALLESRLTEVDKLTETLNKDLMVFQKSNEKTLETIKSKNALLFGKPADKLKDVKFDQVFANAQCASMIDGTSITELGNSGGYEAIQKTIAAQVDKKNEGGFNAKSFATQAANIQQDIISVANQLSSKASSMNPATLFSQPDSMMSAVKSKYNITSLPGFKEAFQRQNTKLAELQANINTQVLSNMNADEQKLFQKNLLDPQLSTASIITNYKNLSDTKCVQQVFEKRFGGIDEFTKLLDDPNRSTKMNREADNKLKNSLPGILNDSTLSLQEKLSQITSSSGINNTLFKAQKTESINGVSLSSGSYVKVNDLFQNIVMEDCRKIANTNNDQGESPTNIINNISQYHSELKQAYSSFPSSLKADIQDELLTCSNDTSKATAGTCSSESYNLGSQSFCLDTARKCSESMLGCADYAKATFNTERTAQQKLANDYKAKLEITKASLMSSYLGIKATLEVKARSLDTLFPGQVYGVVTDEELSLTTDNQALIGDIDPSLKVEDPEKYVEQMKANLTKVRAKIAEQNKAITQKIATEKQNVINNATKQKQAWETIASNCNNLINQYNQSKIEEANQQNKANQEMAQKVNEFCAEARKVSSCPTEGEVDSLNSTMGQITAALQPGDFTAYNNYKKMSQLCKSSGDESANPFVSTGENVKGMPNNDPLKACDDENMARQAACIDLKNFSEGTVSYCKLNESSRLNSDLNDPGKIKISGNASVTQEGKTTQIAVTGYLYCNDDQSKIQTVLCKEDANCARTAAQDLEIECESKRKDKRTEQDKKCDDLNESLSSVAKLWQQYQGVKVAQELGQQSFPSCSASNGSEVGKTAGDAIRGVAGAIQQNSAITNQ